MREKEEAEGAGRFLLGAGPSDAPELERLLAAERSAASTGCGGGEVLGDELSDVEGEVDDDEEDELGDVDDEEEEEGCKEKGGVSKRFAQQPSTLTL